MHLHPSILSCLNSRWRIFKHKNFTWINWTTLLTNKFVMSHHIVILKSKLKDLQGEEAMYRANKSFQESTLNYQSQKGTFTRWLYLKSLGSCKEYIWWWLALFHFWIITKNNMMHQWKEFTMSLCFQFKMPPMRTVRYIIKWVMFEKFCIYFKTKLEMCYNRNWSKALFFPKKKKKKPKQNTFNMRKMNELYPVAKQIGIPFAWRCPIRRLAPTKMWKKNLNNIDITVLYALISE